MSRNDVGSCTFEKAVWLRTFAPKYVEMTCGLDMTVTVAGSLEGRTALAIKALRSTVFPLRLCYLMIAVDVYKVLRVITVFK